MDAVFEFLTKQIYEHLKIIFGTDRNTLSQITPTDYITGLAILFRYVNSRVVPGEKINIIITDEFKNDYKKIVDPKIKKKVQDLLNALSQSSPDLNNTSLKKSSRFAPKSMDRFFFDKAHVGDRYCSDFLLEIFGIQHYHVGYDKHTDDTLVFVWRDWSIKKAIMLGIGKHDEILLQSGNNHIRDSMLNNLPKEITNYLFHKSQFETLAYIPNDKELKTLRDHGINTVFQDSKSGDIYMSPSINLSRIPDHVNFFIMQLKREIPFLFSGVDITKIVGLKIELKMALFFTMSASGRIIPYEVNLKNLDEPLSNTVRLLLVFRRVRQILNCFDA